jgi:hypothetical protein
VSETRWLALQMAHIPDMVNFSSYNAGLHRSKETRRQDGQMSHPYVRGHRRRGSHSMSNGKRTLEPFKTLLMELRRFRNHKAYRQPSDLWNNLSTQINMRMLT